MAHRLNIGDDGRANMFWVGERPWHGLGTELKKPATAKQAIMAARLDYEVKKCPLMAAEAENGKPIGWLKDHVASVRMDTKQVLGVVGQGYQVVQNVDAFSFFDTLVGEGQAIYESAGALDQGQRIWLMAKLPKDIVITREDIIEKYLILANSHDGTSSLKVWFSSCRVVCYNTLTMALQDAKDGISIRHSGDINSKVREARRVLGITIKYYDEFEEIAKYMAKTQISKAELDKYYDDVLGITGKEKESAVLENRKDVLLRLFEHGKGNDRPGVRGSIYAAMNGITEWVDHYKTIKGQDEDPTNRLKSIWFGAGARLKGRAFDLAHAMVEAKR